MASESKLKEALQILKGEVPPRSYEILFHFIDCYLKAVVDKEKGRETLLFFISLVRKECEAPYTFEPYHKKVRRPLDYFKFGNDFVRPLIDLPHSKISGLDHADQIEKQLNRGENVILLANHQTETDPQAISILMEKSHPRISESTIYVAGERVITDPPAIPFSMGCDLLCIYSKRYIDYPPELKEEKQLHNKKTMSLMSELLKEGGKIIYVAPSGGRDRKNSEGVIEVAPFDPGSIEMFYLMAKKAKTPTHFYPLALATYDLLPPPETIQKEIGEHRTAKRSPIFLHFCPEFNMEVFPGSESEDKVERRRERASAIWSQVKNAYQHLAKLCGSK